MRITGQDDLSNYFAGDAIYGEHLSKLQMQQWFDDEENGYAELGYIDSEARNYVYHALNKIIGFPHLTDLERIKALGLGSAFGLEFEPIADQLSDITILEPASKFAFETVCGVPATYLKPVLSGEMPFDDATFDLFTCFGVLHHIPNVSFVFQEACRVVKPGGLMLIREPIVSMGDWRLPRLGLTKHERGLPLPLFRELIHRSSCDLLDVVPLGFPIIQRLAGIFRIPLYNNRLLSAIDIALSKATLFNYRYHRTSVVEKLTPTSAYFVVRKR